MRVLVTGASGFLGLNIVQAIQRAGHEAVAYLRPGPPRRFLDLLGVPVREGALDDTQALAEAMHDMDAVVHTAGATSCNWSDWPQLEATNVGGTQAVLRAAARTGIGRLVFTSTTSTIGSLNHPARAADELRALRGWRARSPYAVSKHAAEQLLLAQRKVPVVVLNVGEVVGPWDHSLQWGRIVLAMAMDRLPFVPPGSATFCSAGDVAKAHARALVAGRAGQRYIVGAHPMRIQDFMGLVAREIGVPVRPQSQWPWACLRAASRVRQGARDWGLRRIAAPAVDPYRMRVFGGHHLFDDSKARRELNYRSESLEDAVRQCHAWYVAHGFVPPPPSTSHSPP